MTSEEGAEKKFVFRHPSFRTHQKELLSAVYDALREGKGALVSAGTGTGKTDVGLSAALTLALDEDLTVFFLTPKISQHQIVLEALGELNEKGFDISAVEFVGRRNLCIDSSARSSSAFYHVCASKRRHEQCPFFSACGTPSKPSSSLEEASSSLGKIKSHDSILSSCESRGVCPYEAASFSARKARVVIADYNHLLIPGIRRVFLARTQNSLSKSIIVVDEVHNVPDRVRSFLSSSIGLKEMDRAIAEAREMDYPLLLQNLSLLRTRFFGWRESIFFSTEQQRLNRLNPSSAEILVSKRDFLKLVPEPDSFVSQLFDCGSQFLSEHPNSRQSSCIELAEFIGLWNLGGKEFARIFSPDSLKCKCLDPSVATSFLNDCRGFVGLSATLQPMDMFARVLGLLPEKTRCFECESPFPKENRLNLISDCVSTKFTERDEEGYSLIASSLQQTIDALGGRVAVFFPSFKVLNSIVPMLSCEDGFVQREGMGPREVSELISSFRDSKGVLFGVSGGSFSEGVDYNMGEIKCVAVVGVPLAEMNLEQQCLIDYYDEKFGDGWDYGYVFPAMNKALQASGRGIRNENDRCVVVFMDKRFAWKRYSKYFPKEWELFVSNEPWLHFREFFYG